MRIGDQELSNDVCISTTVRLVSRDPRFRCSGHRIQLNPSLESSWSMKLKFVTFDLNIVIIY